MQSPRILDWGIRRQMEDHGRQNTRDKYSREKCDECRRRKRKCIPSKHRDKKTGEVKCTLCIDLKQPCDLSTSKSKSKYLQDKRAAAKVDGSGGPSARQSQQETPLNIESPTFTSSAATSPDLERHFQLEPDCEDAPISSSSGVENTIAFGDHLTGSQEASSSSGYHSSAISLQQSHDVRFSAVERNTGKSIQSTGNAADTFETSPNSFYKLQNMIEVIKRCQSGINMYSNLESGQRDRLDRQIDLLWKAMTKICQDGDPLEAPDFGMPANMTGGFGSTIQQGYSNGFPPSVEGIQVPANVANFAPAMEDDTASLSSMFTAVLNHTGYDSVEMFENAGEGASMGLAPTMRVSGSDGLNTQLNYPPHGVRELFQVDQPASDFGGLSNMVISQPPISASSFDLTGIPPQGQSNTVQPFDGSSVNQLWKYNQYGPDAIGDFDLEPPGSR